MKAINIKPLLAVLCLFGCSVLSAQDNTSGKKRAYDIWIKQVDSGDVTRGVLYETADSSIFIVPSLKSDQVLEFRADGIDLLKLRKRRSIIVGAITGSAIGFVAGAVDGYKYAADVLFFRGIFVLGFGAVYGLAGMGAGALAGSMKDRIPVRASQENYEKYRGSLQQYAYLDEPSRHPVFIHRGYASQSLGFSRAGGEFANNLTVKNYPGMEMSGSAIRWEIGYFFSIDLIPSLGVSSLTLYHDDKKLIDGNGLGLSFAGKMAYLMSKRWNLHANASYLSSNQKYKRGDSGKANAFDLSFGVDYKFGKKSL